MDQNSTIDDGKAVTLGQLLRDKLAAVEVVVGTPPELAPVQPTWEIITVKNSTNRIRILHDELRQFLCYNTDFDIVPGSHVVQSDDTLALARRRRNDSVYEVSSFFQHLNDLQNFTESDMAYVDWATFQKFVELITKQAEEYSALASEGFDKGEINFLGLQSYLNLPGRRIAYLVEGHMFAMIVDSCQVRSSFFSGTYLELNGTCYIHDGKGFLKVRVKHKIPAFGGKVNPKDLGIYNLDQQEEFKQRLLARGNKYANLNTKASYVAYKGELVRKSYWYTHHFKATGRIMVDVKAMRSIDSNYEGYFGIDRYSDRDDANNSRIEYKDFTDEMKILTPPYVYGFSFSAKKWGEMIIDNISDIQFRTDAFDKLVLDHDTKDIVYSLVDVQYTATTDLIDGKGGGCIFLLEGPPGVGKTLTAEAVAEKLQRPLYMAGVGELGTNVSDLEDTLSDILDVATSWNAVLLLDEADIFLRTRDGSDLERNAMVGVFLRLLEYYPGMLFLTTNLAGNIDPAFFSRISMAIHYKQLETSSRAKVWKNLLSTAGIEGIDAEALSKHELNGRQIKNCIRSAASLAMSKGRPVCLEDFQRVINKSIEFERNKHSALEAPVAKHGFFAWLKRLFK